MRQPELLAPAGDFETLEAAFNHGADAVYAGVGPFNLRAHSPSFTLDELPELIDFVKKKDKSLYVVINTMPDDLQLLQITDFIKKLSSFSLLPNAIIVSDPGVISLCREYLSSVSLHLSTQTGTFNNRSMKFWVSQGISRVILPRELNLDRIKSLCKDAVCETELFIHGAMCVSISGRCLLGAYLTGRNPNQGECPQPCRFKYDIKPVRTDSCNEEEWFTVEEESRGIYLLNSKDLNSVSILPEIIDTGVSSLKIEGRNKSVHYVSSVVKVYREAIDSYFDNPSEYRVEQRWLDELGSLDHRSYTTGFYNGEYIMQENFFSKTKPHIRIVGVVKAKMKNGAALVDVKNPFFAGETINVLPVNRKKNPFNIIFSNIKDINGNIIERALTNRIVAVESEQPLVVGDIIRHHHRRRDVL